jgi:hypothetical protein
MIAVLHSLESRCTAGYASGSVIKDYILDPVLSRSLNMSGLRRMWNLYNCVCLMIPGSR